MTGNSASRSPAPLLFALLACVAACVAIDSQSLWIDEAQTALKAIPPTLHGWWQALDREHNSNMQFPLYMLYIWGWARVFGVSEVALRAANLPCFFLGLFAIAHFLRRHPGLRNATLLLYCLHPFVWYYVNEARPYHMQLSGALLVAGCLFAALDEPDKPLGPSWWWLYAAGLTILCGAGLLGVPWAIALSVPMVLRPGFWQSMTRAGRPALAVFLPVLIVLALYLAWTVKQNIQAGYRSMSIPIMFSPFYDELGFIGLGPGRNALRPASLANPGNEMLSTLRAYILPLSLLGLPLVGGLILAARRRFGLSPGRLATVLLVSLIPLSFVFAVGFARHVRILGRHLTPLFPFILIAEACALLALWKSGRLIGRAAAVLIVLAITLSSLENRFAFRHSKDDYRAAAALARQALAHGETVWWAASPDGAQYYGLPYATRETPGSAFWIYGVPAGFTAPPDEIVLSKPDISDPDGSLARFIAARHYHVDATFQAFTIWSL